MRRAPHRGTPGGFQDTRRGDQRPGAQRLAGSGEWRVILLHPATPLLTLLHSKRGATASVRTPRGRARMSGQTNRREFLQAGAAAGIGFYVAGQTVAEDKKERSSVERLKFA